MRAFEMAIFKMEQNNNLSGERKAAGIASFHNRVNDLTLPYTEMTTRIMRVNFLNAQL